MWLKTNTSGWVKLKEKNKKKETIKKYKQNREEKNQKITKFFNGS